MADPEMTDASGGVGSPDETRADRRPCPHCAGMILPAANVCRYCGRDVTQATL